VFDFTGESCYFINQYTIRDEFPATLVTQNYCVPSNSSVVKYFGILIYASRNHSKFEFEFESYLVGKS
jgi:hypothetical protein